MSTHTIIHLCGLHAFLFAVFHVLFWRLFRWKKDLASLHFSNRAILQIANVQLIWLFLLVAALCSFFTDELAGSRLGHAVLLGFSVFWAIRAVQQFIFLRVNDWRVHLLTVMFVIGAFIFAWPVLFA